MKGLGESNGVTMNIITSKKNFIFIFEATIAASQRDKNREFISIIWRSIVSIHKKPFQIAYTNPISTVEQAHILAQGK